MKDEPKKQVDLKTRTRQFALRIIRLYASLPSSTVAQTLGKQLLRSGTSVGAHYREGIRSRSNAEIISKWSGALQELEESSYWLELFVESGVLTESQTAGLIQECDELIAILTTCVKKVKEKSHA